MKDFFYNFFYLNKCKNNQNVICFVTCLLLHRPPESTCIRLFQ